MAYAHLDPEVYGSILILHDVTSNTILLGEEGTDLFDTKVKTSNYYRFHPVLTHPLLETGAGPSGLPFRVSREELTRQIIGPIMSYINTHTPPTPVTLGTNLLFPIVELSRDKLTPPIPDRNNYFSRPRIQTGSTEGCPKGGKKGTETALDCIQREVYEEIGDIGRAIPITERDWIRDRTGRRYITDGLEPYAIFYKQVNQAQIQAIMTAIAARRALFMGEMFDLGFKRVPPPPVRGRTDGLNLKTRTALTKVQAFLFTQGQQLYGGAKQSRRRINRKRRTTSKRR